MEKKEIIEFLEREAKRYSELLAIEGLDDFLQGVYTGKVAELHYCLMVIKGEIKEVK